MTITGSEWVVDASASDRSPAAAVAGTRPSIEWRSTHRDLWVARFNGQHLCMVERGRRFSVTDAEGELFGLYRTLEQAMDGAVALTESSRPMNASPSTPAAQQQSHRSHGWGGVAIAGAITCIGTALLAGYGLILL